MATDVLYSFSCQFYFPIKFVCEFHAHGTGTECGFISGSQENPKTFQKRQMFINLKLLVH